MVSIHAPVKGATVRTMLTTPESLGFNPRTRKGCDLFLLPLQHFTIVVSIHAPVKGATKQWRPVLLPFSSFNPRTRKGCDLRQTLSHRQRLRVSIHAPVKGATAPLSGPVNRAFQGHFSRTSSFSDENEGDFPKGFYFTCVFNGLAMRASHGGRPVRLGCPHVTVW